MSKNPLDKKELEKIIKTTQNIEGCKEPMKELLKSKIEEELTNA